MNTDKSINALNILLEVHNNRIQGYETALSESEEAFLEENDLKILFTEFINNSQECKAVLVQEVINLGGIPIKGTDTASKFFRLWMDVKYALTCNDRYTILKSCEEGEGIAVQSYSTVLADNTSDLTPIHKEIIAAQHTLLKHDQNKVKNLFERSLDHE